MCVRTLSFCIFAQSTSCSPAIFMMSYSNSDTCGEPGVLAPRMACTPAFIAVIDVCMVVVKDLRTDDISRTALVSAALLRLTSTLPLLSCFSSACTSPKTCFSCTLIWVSGPGCASLRRVATSGCWRLIDGSLP